MNFCYDDLKRIFFKFDPEIAHAIVEKSMMTADVLAPSIYSFVAKRCVVDDVRLKQNLLGSTYHNPIGIGGGFDKNATMLRGLAALGFGYFEYGTFTPYEQKGNAKPRLFRLVDEESIQNAMGFNNDGAKAIKKRLKNTYPFVLPLWANIGKNKLTPNEMALNQYEFLTREFDAFCDVFVINISSPNTPNLRALQETSFINELFLSLKEITKKPIILKIAPDLTHEKAVEISNTAVNAGASGIIISNTSVDYSLSNSKNLQNFGGLSGRVIKERSREIFKVVADELFGKTVLIACGGIDDANEAYQRIKMGANLVQIFTSFIYKGPKICFDINSGILKLLEQDGFSHISQAVGCEVKKG